MKTILQTIQSGAPYLEKAGVENPRLNMEHLLAKVLKCKRLQLYMMFDRPLSDAELEPLRDLTRRRAKREPLQHVLGTVEFHQHEFKCDARALIPRPETEELVEKILTEYKTAEPPKRLLDMGTGSGVIGLSLLHAFPEATGILADLSPDALALAKENAELTKLPPERVTFVGTDLFQNLSGEVFDLIVANLPYIPAAEIETLSEEVKRDPVLALDGGVIGTEIIERFADGARAHASPGALIALEIGAGQSIDLAAALTARGFTDVRAVNDYQGRDRFLFARVP